MAAGLEDVHLDRHLGLLAGQVIRARATITGAISTVLGASRFRVSRFQFRGIANKYDGYSLETRNGQLETGRAGQPNGVRCAPG
jgi:hypothetical protein